MKSLYHIICLYLLLLSSCQFFVLVSYNEVSATDEIREKAFFAAEYYADADIEYELGGSETTYVPTYSVRGLDCSGLVNNVYEYAIEDTNYSLLYSDATADQIYSDYSEPIENPEQGDLMVWRDDDDHAYHIAIYWKTEENKYWFIESNDIPQLGIDGTAYRSLSIDNPYNTTFRRMLLSEEVYR